MQKTFVGILILLVIVVLFALENKAPVKISFWLWEVDAQLSMVLILSVTFGAAVSYLLSLPGRFKKNKEITEKGKKISQLEDEILSLSEKLNLSSGKKEENTDISK
jgi:putative membrane protein